MIFYWVKNEPQVVVQCSVQVEGETLTAKTKFEVRRPQATWTLTPKAGQVTVTTGVCDVAGNPDIFYWMTTGRNCNSNEFGMYYAYELNHMDGYTGSYEVSWVQLVEIDWLANFSEPPFGTAAPGGWYSFEKHTKGLDTSYPYTSWGQLLQNWDRDTPRHRLLRSEKFWWRRDKFEAYLLWKPTRAASIPVPLKVAHWNWQAKARRYDTNIPPLWALISGGDWPTVHPLPASGTDVYLPPTWTNNVIKVPFQFNTYWFTEP